MFSCEFSEISKNIVFAEHMWMTATDPINLKGVQEDWKW